MIIILGSHFVLFLLLKNVRTSLISPVSTNHNANLVPKKLSELFERARNIVQFQKNAIGGGITSCSTMRGLSREDSKTVVFIYSPCVCQRILGSLQCNDGCCNENVTKIELCVSLSVLRLFCVSHVVQSRRSALSPTWREWFSCIGKE